MDLDDTWVLHVLRGILPDQTLEILKTHILHPSSTFRTTLTYLSSNLQQLFASYLLPLLQPLLERVMQALQDSPDLVVLGFFLGFVVLVLQLVVWLHRTMMFFTRLAARLLFWSLVAGVVAMVWQRGPEATIRDVVVVVSKLVGYAAVVKDIWWSEYQKYDAQTKSGSAGTRSAGRGSSSAGYGRSRRAAGGW